MKTTIYITNLTEPVGAGVHRVVASYACGTEGAARKAAEVFAGSFPMPDACVVETIETEENGVLVMGEIHTARGSWHFGWTQISDLPDAFGKEWATVEETFNLHTLPGRGTGTVDGISYRLRSETVKKLGAIGNPEKNAEP